ncbi:DNA ligase D [Nitrospira sp. KM1]|uniref:DNA ligase D n=1 Tax=Nitrospira sp. KM1 TaxID=1936990 RepID=UPI0013A71F61|nr:DNA ligase D [Nitrospira sp. KM1]BCA56046.1 DNA ligase D [Nitrospira sp. KM1]
MSLKRYHQKRRFRRTPEPKGRKAASAQGHLYVIQKHAASRLHYDFRLELDGVLKSWAVPKGPSLDPAVKRLAMHVEDHPVEYGSFEGIIPKGEYGGGTVMLWDKGTWQPVGDPSASYRAGKLKFVLDGERLKGGWMLARMKARKTEHGDPWLLIKETDGYSSRSEDSDDEGSESVVSGRTMEEIASQRNAVWSSHRKKELRAPSPLKRIGSAASRQLFASAPGARKTALPKAFRPQLATLVDRPPAGDGWLHEIKLDGYRLLAFIRNGRATLMTRNGLDWTAKFPTLVEALAGLPVQEGMLDGEVVVIRADGTTDFQALQGMLQNKSAVPLHYYIFDVPYGEGYDLTQVPLLERKEILNQLLSPHVDTHSVIRYSDHVLGHGEDFHNHACSLKAEGMISKDVSSHYSQRRSPQWLKIKCTQQQEFVIGGYTDPGGARTGFGALLIGVYEGGRHLRYTGRVGTGFSQELLGNVMKQLRARETSTMPFKDFPKDISRRGVHWVNPELVAEIRFTEWTSDNVLRHPAFLGLRADKSPHEVIREAPKPMSEAAAASPPKGRSRRKEPAAALPSPFKLTNSERILYPEQGITKLMLAQYYQTMASWILPHIVRRPLTIVRCPHGYDKQCFYQKHVMEGLPPSIRGVRVKEKHGSMTTLVIDDLDGLTGLVQLGVLEIHPWGCTEDSLNKPDRLVFDLDPAPDVPLNHLIEAAQLVRDLLEAIELTSFVKTTGGKGLHVVVPLTPRVSWDELKQFAKQIAGSLASHDPKRYIDVMAKSRRAGKIFVDYLRNGYGATSVAAYSTRARAGATVSAPLRWKELAPKLDFTSFNLNTVPSRLAGGKSDPWEGFATTRQSLTPAMIRQVATLNAKLLRG